ncbi:MAG TPA: hypothetical protein VGG34_07120 [Opitutaceae bacterium]|jgi:pimeloyl-ACP methyl ester carboxylesterase
MKPQGLRRTAIGCALLAFAALCLPAQAAPGSAWQHRHDALVARLRALSGHAGDFGPAYAPLFRAALPWYELWGGRDDRPVDADMVSPEDYAGALADSLEHGRNYFAENPSCLFPLVFHRVLADGTTADANYWLTLPAGFPDSAAKYPLIVGLHGSGWLAHKISFKRLSTPPGRTFSVTPIDMAGPWKIPFLNAYLDELLEILPVDADRVYVEGHSLGAMATWEWALDNPERFAAISPRAGIGEPYRASRLKSVPSWVIQGAEDDVIPPGFAEEMVTALESQGAPVQLSLLRGGPHNMPVDLDEGQVIDWYLRQVRSHDPVPADPRDSLGLDASGSSPWTVMTVAAHDAWSAGPVPTTDPARATRFIMALFKHARDRAEWPDSPIRREIDPATGKEALWLAAPQTLHPGGEPADASLVRLPAKDVVRFYSRGRYRQGLAHLDAIRPQIAAKGLKLTGRVWITNLSIWWDSPATIGEYWAEVVK